MDNAVAYYFHLCDQGVDPDAAAAHTQQRFGVFPDTLYGPIHVEAARELLAEARAYLADGSATLDEADRILRELYAVITGESP